MELILDDDQKRCIELVKQSKSVFITSEAGCGKTFVLSEIVKELEPDIFGLTATTGTAAVLLANNISGVNSSTLHSFLGIGLAKDSAIELYKKVSKTWRLKPKYDMLRYKLKILIIDEVSMIDSVLFDKIDEYLRLIKCNDLSFGGVQIILSGDFAQLTICDNYCFESDAWKQLNPICINLKHQYRQDTDTKFKEILTKLRFGICDDESFSILSNCDNVNSNDVKPIRLCPLNRMVSLINDNEQRRLINNGASCKKYTINRISENNMKIKSILTNANIQDNLILAIGSQAMLTYNLDIPNGLINGTNGMITKLNENSVEIKTFDDRIITIPYVEYTEYDNIKKKDDMIFTYLPVILAFSLSIHKAQGKTIDYLEIDFMNTFACGQGYVAISRAKNLNSLIIKNLKKNVFKCDSRVKAFYKSLA